MACCDGCAKSGGNSGGSTSLASHQAKLDARRHELAGRGCAQCTNFAWHGPAQVLVTAADGSRHHPSCPTIASLSGYGGGGIAEGLGEGRHAVSEGTKARGLGLPKGAGILAPGASLRLGSRLTSPNGRYSARLQQSDGNFVVYDNQGIDNALWSPGVNGRGVVRATMQTDGNFVLYNAKDVAIWATGRLPRHAERRQPRPLCRERAVSLEHVRGVGLRERDLRIERSSRRRGSDRARHRARSDARRNRRRVGIGQPRARDFDDHVRRRRSCRCRGARARC